MSPLALILAVARDVAALRLERRYAERVIEHLDRPRLSEYGRSILVAERAHLRAVDARIDELEGIGR